MALTTKNRLAKLAAGITAATLGTIAVLGAAMPAHADPNIDASQRGSITIHKYEEPATPTGQPHNGTELAESALSGLTPLAGVEFTVQQLTAIDLTAAAGWTTLQSVTPQTAANYELQSPGTALATNQAGTATFQNLPVGAYLVTETNPGANQIVSATAPFIVTIPLAQGNDWLYNVHVYPKNSVAGISKTVDDSAARGLGDTVSWTITAKVPEVPVGQTFSSFTITDQLAEQLAYASGTVALSSGTTLTENTDYTLTHVDGLVTLAFTAAGRTKLAAESGASVQLTLSTTVVAIGTGTIENRATVNVNGHEFSSDPVSTLWGAVRILKHQRANESAVLAGAQFQVFSSETDATDRTNPVSINGATTFTTGADGTVLLEGLKAGQYWLVETRAPLGYQALTAPIAVTVAAGTVDAPTQVTVENDQVPAFALPLTGGAGTVAFIVGGIALLVAAFGVALMRRRRQTAQQ